MQTRINWTSDVPRVAIMATILPAAFATVKVLKIVQGRIDRRIENNLETIRETQVGGLESLELFAKLEGILAPSKQNQL